MLTLKSGRAKPTLFICAVIAGCLAVCSGASASIKIAAAGDISCPADSTRLHKIEPGEPEPPPAAEKCKAHRVAKMIEAEHPKAVLALGDLIQGQESFMEAYTDFSKAWFSVLGKRIFATPGNHDYHRNSSGRFTASGYFRYWKHKGANVVKYGEPHRGWSSWDTGRWHMVNLNSNCFATDCAFSGQQLRWLLRDLKADRRNRKTKCTLAYFHHPLFSAGFPRGRNPRSSLLVNVWELLYRYRTDIVLNGHQHHYERFRRQNPSGKIDSTGIAEIISGTGGVNTFPVEDEDDRMAPHSAASFRGLGATFLKLGNGKYRTYFRGLDGEVRDATRVRKCHRMTAGKKRRVPRTKRYVALMRRLDRLRHRILDQKRKIAKLESSLSTRQRRVGVGVAKLRLRQTIDLQERVREKTLY